MKVFLNVLLAFAAGALVFDVIIHLIPHAFFEVIEQVEELAEGRILQDEHDHDEHDHDEHDHDESPFNKISMSISFGILGFALIDMLIQSFGGTHTHAVEKDPHLCD